MQPILLDSSSCLYSLYAEKMKQIDKMLATCESG